MLNRGYAYASVLGGKEGGRTLLEHLVAAYPHSTREQWQGRLDGGEVSLDGLVAKGSELLKLGQTLVWRRPPWVEPEAPREFGVVLDDAELLAVNKPSGLPTLPGGGFLENTLLRLVQARWPEANPVHRLGRGTSGIVMFGKTREAAATLTAEWNTPRVRKVYRAVAQGVAERERYEILTPIGLVPHPRLGLVWAAKAGGKAATSWATVVARGAGTTTFAVSLGSGRPHQIRIHLASVGHPLVGDPLYGAGGVPVEELPGLPGDGGYRLHAQFLRFRHPGTGAEVELQAELPAGF